LGCYGSIAYKKALAGDYSEKGYAEEKMDEAIRLLEAAVSRYPKIRTYVYLAMACKKKIEFLDNRINKIVSSGNAANPGGAQTNDNRETEQTSSSSENETKKSSKDKMTKLKQNHSPSQRYEKDNLESQKQQKIYCLKESYYYIKKFENKRQYSIDYPDEYSDEMEELKKYIEGLNPPKPNTKPIAPKKDNKPEASRTSTEED
jgi:hypothetical protein